MKIEGTKATKNYTNKLTNLRAGYVYEVLDREGYYLATDELSIVELSNGILWNVNNWAGMAKFREVNAKVVIE